MTSPDIAAQVLAHIRIAGPQTADQVSAALGIPAGNAYGWMRRLVKDGLLRGDRSRPGAYCCTAAGVKHKFRPHDALSKIYRAMRINETWTLREIALLTGASVHYIKKYIIYLRTQGHAERVGRKDHEAIYRLTARAPIAAPTMKKAGLRAERKAGPVGLCRRIIRAVEGKNIAAAREIYEQLGEALGRRT